MPRIVLVRHAQPAAAWGDDPDPGLSETGRRQAAVAAEVVAGLGGGRVLTSPLRRCRETAEPLLKRWGVEPAVVPAVGEVASPPGVGIAERGDWLGSILAGTWSTCPPAPRRWRQEVIATVQGLSTDAVVFSHFVAINAVIGWALGDDRVLMTRLGHCSRTVVEVTDHGLTLVEMGEEASTVVG